MVVHIVTHTQLFSKEICQLEDSVPISPFPPFLVDLLAFAVIHVSGRMVRNRALHFNVLMSTQPKSEK